jgi:CubicO group peptidase (beta-lactamase class C family)
MPAVNGIGQVRSIARVCSAFATGGAELDLRPETLAALEAPAVPPAEGLRDCVLHANVCYGLGLFKPSPYFDFGSSPRAFGITGVGGSFCYVDPDAQVGYAYAPNRMGPRPWDDPREKAVRDAFMRCLRKLSSVPTTAPVTPAAPPGAR